MGGRKMTKKLALVGVKKGRLVCIKELGKKLLCKCDCGVEKEIYRGNFIAGYTSSCGCYRDGQVSKANTVHGERQNPIYYIWQAMKRRCYNHMHRAYPWYGGKGVGVCDRWQEFKNFYEDMNEGYFKGLTLDRKNPLKDYSKENCAWATKSENSRGVVYGKEL
jgi:hypothetical protein